MFSFILDWYLLAYLKQIEKYTYCCEQIMIKFAPEDNVQIYEHVVISRLNNLVEQTTRSSSNRSTDSLIHKNIILRIFSKADVYLEISTGNP